MCLPVYKTRNLIVNSFHCTQVCMNGGFLQHFITNVNVSMLAVFTVKYNIVSFQWRNCGNECNRKHNNIDYMYVDIRQVKERCAVNSIRSLNQDDR